MMLVSWCLFWENAAGTSSKSQKDSTISRKSQKRGADQEGSWSGMSEIKMVEQPWWGGSCAHLVAVASPLLPRRVDKVGWGKRRRAQRRLVKAGLAAVC